ncbi:hypothetical protein AC1031_015000 [Aphanomyces cochlioides]|nr:hypothetical protein AC1031_015000 [Aphanomyces cochlioides]
METKDNLVKPEPAPEYSKLESPGSIASVIRAQAEDDDELPHCYICMDSTSGEENSPMELIAPCSCPTYVHRKCLDNWRATSFTYNCMTHCPTCRNMYEFELVVADNSDELKKKVHKARWWRAFIVLLVVLVSSMVIALIDAGTPKFFNLHWDGKIYHWIGLKQVPRFVIYFLLSLAMTALITCLVILIRWCWYNGVCDGCAYGCDRTQCCVLDIDGPNSGVCCGCNGCDCSGDCGEFAIILIGVILVCAVVAGLVLIFIAIVGGVGSVVDRRGERRIRALQVQQSRIKNLRPLSLPTAV